MKANFRVRETEKGFIVEEGVEVWSLFGGNDVRWSCAVCYLGTDEPFYFSTFESALRELHGGVDASVRYNLMYHNN